MEYTTVMNTFLVIKIWRLGNFTEDHDTYIGMFNHVASKGNTKCLFPILQCTSFTSNTNDLATSFSQTSASNTSCKDNHVTIKQNRLVQTKIRAFRTERKIDTRLKSSKMTAKQSNIWRELTRIGSHLRKHMWRQLKGGKLISCKHNTQYHHQSEKRSPFQTNMVTTYRLFETSTAQTPDFLVPPIHI